MVIEFVSIDMMHVQMNTPTLALFAAILACPFVTAFDFLAKPFPVGRVLPLGNATLPSGIFGATRRAAQDQRFGQRTAFDTVLVHRLDDNRRIDTELRGDFVDRTRLVNVLATQPISIMVQLFWTVMAWCVCLPLAVLADPLDSKTTAAFAQRRGAIGLIDGLAGATLSRFGIRAPLVSVLLKKVANVTSRAAKHLGSFFIRGVKVGRQASPVVVTDRYFLRMGVEVFRSCVFSVHGLIVHDKCRMGKLRLDYRKAN